MDESIKRVEKLVHATNSALAQMKFSLMFDDVTEGKQGTTAVKSEDFNGMVLNKFFEKDDLRQCQNEFQAEANEILANVEKLFSSSETDRKNLKALDRIKELNNKKKQFIKLEQSKAEEIEQSRHKLLSLIREEKFGPRVNSLKEFVGSKLPPFDQEKESWDRPHSAPRKIDLLPSISKTPVKTKLELKKKILEAEEIVDRGFLTARQLAQKVECMTKCDRKEKTPSSDKTASDSNFKGSGSRTESSDTVESLRCKRHSAKKKDKEKLVSEVKRINARVIDVKKNELQRRERPNLQFQRLPSVHIKGGLKLQQIHNLEIPASEESTTKNSNTAISFLSHEEVKREKMKKILEKVQRENRIEDVIRRNYVECFNCGKLIRIRETSLDPRKIDDILYECNFNVFDPRIDEFVEKFGAISSENFCESTRLEKPATQSVVFVAGESETNSKKFTENLETKTRTEECKQNKHFTLQEFSNKLFKKYRQELESLEDKHVKFDNLLQNVFREVDESRGVFDDCHFLKNLKPNSKSISNLSVTAPVLVTLSGSSFKNKGIQKKFHKERLKKINENKTETSELEIEKEKILCSTLFSSKTQAENANAQEEVLSFSNFTQNKEVKPNQKEFPGRLYDSPTGQSGKSECSDRKEEMYEKPLSTPLNTSSPYDNSEATVKHKRDGINQVVTAIAEETGKPLNRALAKEETLSESFATLSLDKDETIVPSKKREEEAEDEKTSTASSSVSWNKIGRIRFEGREKNKPDELKTLVSISVQSRTVKALLTREEVERVSPAISPKNKINNDIKEKAEILETSSLEKSENNYESDFESFSNELEEKDDFCKDEEPKVITRAKKLSTISEVDSESENKSSEGSKILMSLNCEMQDTQCKVPETVVQDIIPQMKEVDHLLLNKGNSVVSEIPFKRSKCKKTSKAYFKNVPIELVTSLKDVLTALQDQCVRTESLANKLTENVKMEGKKSDPNSTSLENLVLSPWEMLAPPNMVENLQSARKSVVGTSRSSVALFIAENNADRNVENEKSEKDLSFDGLSDEGGSSLGEIIVSERRKKNSENSGGSSISERSYLNLDGAKKSSWFSSAQEKQMPLPE